MTIWRQRCCVWVLVLAAAVGVALGMRPVSLDRAAPGAAHHSSSIDVAASKHGRGGSATYSPHSGAVSRRCAAFLRGHSHEATTAKLREITARLYTEPPRAAWTAAATGADHTSTATSTSMPRAAASCKVAPGRGGGAAILERPAPQIGFQRGTERAPVEMFKVLLYNDDDNTREFVARSLVQVVDVPEATAYDIMSTAHTTGMALVGIWHGELAEAYRDQLKVRGLVSEIFPVDDC